MNQMCNPCSDCALHPQNPFIFKLFLLPPSPIPTGFLSCSPRLSRCFRGYLGLHPPFTINPEGVESRTFQSKLRAPWIQPFFRVDRSFGVYPGVNREEHEQPQAVRLESLQDAKVPVSRKFNLFQLLPQKVLTWANRREGKPVMRWDFSI